MPVYPSGGTIAQSAGSPGFGPAPAPVFNASGSVRFNTADSANMTITPSLQGSRTNWTWSTWVKRSSLGVIQYIASVYSPALNYTFQFQFSADNAFEVYDYNAGGSGNYVWRVKTTQVFRDPASWYHILLSVDTTQATAANRVSIYVNGVLVTALAAATYPTQYYQTVLNTLYTIYIGSYLNSAGAGGYYLGAYLADINFVDGLALTPSSFTATDANTGQLVPAQYTGNRGINGFYLPFSGAALAVDLGQNPKTTGQDFPYWPYNTLLVNTTSTNGAQNNTFLDSSTNNFTITRNGNTTQGNFTPFTFGGGTTQANGYYSGYFDGTGDFISIPSSAQLNLSGDFTIEMFFLLNNATSGATQGLIANGAGSFVGTAAALIFGHVLNPTKLSFFVQNISATPPLLVSLTAPVSGQWYHVAITRSGSTIRLFINGQQESSYSSSGTISLDATLTKLGAYWNGDLNGYISNARVVKGTAVYTANFTVPTTPLTNITNTSLLTCQSSQFIDNSTNAFVVTANGNTQPLPTNPFGMTAWSGYFDGTGDYLTVANNAALDPNTDSFCMECWVYITGTTGNNQGFNGKGVAGTSGYSFFITNALLLSFIWNGTGGATITGGTLSLNTWNHVAVVRNSGVIRLYLNGVGAASSTACTTDINSTNGLFIGQARGGNPILGNMSNYRMTKGTLPPGYDATTSTLPVPTAPLTAISGTSLLTCQSSTFIDNSTNAFSINVFGNSYTGTLNNPFGNPINYTTRPVQAWSNYFDGTGDYLSTTVSAAQVGTGDFTIEFFCYLPQALDANDTLLSHGYAAAAFTNGWYLQSNGTKLSFGIGSAGAGSSVLSNIDTPVRRWFHFAITRVGSLLRVWQDGLLTGSMTNAQNGTATNFFTIASASTNYYSTCNISNLRIIKGQSIYNANFTVPTSPLTAVQNTSLLTCQSNTFVDNSITNATVTKNGDALISSLSPFIPTQSWSAASYGGTMYFDGTGDYLSIADNATLEFGSSDFTIEAFIYPTATTGANRPIWSHGTNSTNWMSLYLHTTAGRPEFAIISGGSTIVDIWPADVISPNIWYHLAVTRSGSTFRMFLNGALIGTGTNASAVPDYTDDYRVGFGRWSGDTGVYAGNISGLRILKGTALYTTPFVPPVLPPTAVTNTTLLLNATNSGIYDATGQNVIETVGNAQVSTAVKKWGESSIAFDGTGDRLFVPTNANFGFGTGAFTVEAWVYPATAFSTFQTIVDARISNGATPWLLGISTTGLARSYDGTTVRTGGQLTSLAWNHVAWSRTFSGVNYVTVNGVVGHTWSASTDFGATKSLTIGSGAAGYGELLTGYIQDLRITKGAGRYSGAFTPPAAAFAYNQYDICNQQWTPGNISVTAGVGQDNLFDSPSDFGTDTGLGGQVRGNYATLNPLNNGSESTLSNGNLDISWSAVAGHSAGSTIAVSSGKWYAEFTRGSSPTLIGIIPSTFSGKLNNWPGNAAYGTNSYGYFSTTGNKFNNSSPSAYGASYAIGDVIGVALDLDAGTLVFYKNGVSQGVAYSSITGSYIFAIGYGEAPTGGTVASANFGQRAFAYAAPAGFKCLVSTNLPTTNGIGATSSTQADNYFDVTTYTGNGTTQSVLLRGAGFTPDFTWIKSRSSGTEWHILCDSLRGPNKLIYSNSDTAEATVTNVLNSFDSGGFSVGYNSAYASARTNTSAATYLGLAWRANGSSGATNNDGSITATVSANTTNGFSVVRYTGTGANGTIGHGLGKQLKFIMVKELSNTDSWLVWHIAIPGTNYMVLNTSAGSTAGATVWNSTVPSSSAPYVFSVGTNTAINQSGQQYVAYCFTDISSFSSMGSFAGNSSADGPMIYTGFKPAWFFTKKYTAVGSAQSWTAMNDATLGYNTANYQLYLQTAGAEQTGAAGGYFDILSNGFKLRTNNAFDNNASDSYIYVAFAAFPFKYSRAY